ncbi:MAG: peptidase [Parcubacteria group bacterium]|nr:peptidase [Parcubacteria group bacterium]
MNIEFIFQIAILIMSVVIHEVSHGYAANYLGDPTAKYAGRLTLNPFKHLELFGSFILPVISYFAGGLLLGWAKPVPYNPHNLRPGRWSEALVALAGPFSNLCIVLIFGLVLRFGGLTNINLIHGIAVIVFLNLLLMVFNLVPLPPLDGSKLLYALLPEKTYALRGFFERYGFTLVLFFIFFFGGIINPIVAWLFGLITGASLG